MSLQKGFDRLLGRHSVPGDRAPQGGHDEPGAEPAAVPDGIPRDVDNGMLRPSEGPLRHGDRAAGFRKRQGVRHQPAAEQDTIGGRENVPGDEGSAGISDRM